MTLTIKDLYDLFEMTGLPGRMKKVKKNSNKGHEK